MISVPRRRISFGSSGPVAAIVILLAVRNVAEVRLPDAAYVPTNVATGAVLLVLARRWGSSWEVLGVDRRHLGRGLSVGAAAAAVAMFVMGVGAAWPVTRGFFDDGRVPVDASGGERLYQMALRIPVGTVAFEELAFRGVLLGLLIRRYSTAVAVSVSSALFGLWHIVPTLAAARANEIMGFGRIGVVLGAVLVTFIGGILFCWLRIRGRHLLAPALLHLAFNDTGYFLAWWVRS